MCGGPGETVSEAAGFDYVSRLSRCCSPESWREGELRPLRVASFSRLERAGFLSGPAVDEEEPVRYFDLRWGTREKAWQMSTGHSVDRSQLFSPLLPERVLQHLDPPHEIRLEILDAPSLALQERNSGSHLCALDLPFVSVLFISPPFALEVVQDASEGIFRLGAGRRVLTSASVCC